MNNQQDLTLKDLFADSAIELSDDNFTAGVMARTRLRKQQMIAGVTLFALFLVALSWVFSVPQALAPIIAKTLAITLIDLGEGWLAWAAAPINNIGSILLLCWKIARVIRRKLGYHW